MYADQLKLMTSRRYILTISCTNRPGLVASISNTIHQMDGDIIELHQFDDEATHRFFSRQVFDCAEESEYVESRISELAKTLDLDWCLQLDHRKLRTIVLVSKQDHCLSELLYLQHTGDLKIDIVAIVSNHPKESLSLSQIKDIPFFHFPITVATKPAQESKIMRLVEDLSADLVILARYMQILSEDLVKFLEGRCINIHHSFLPGFKGAKPYHQAYARGVKMIGATAHYVTSDLDEGPIIAQDVETVSHADYPPDLVRKGREIERRVLARAVQYHADHRVFLNGDRTVVFMR